MFYLFHIIAYSLSKHTVTDHSKQTTFITNQFITDHINIRLVHNMPRSEQTSL